MIRRFQKINVKQFINGSGGGGFQMRYERFLMVSRPRLAEVPIIEEEETLHNHEKGRTKDDELENFVKIYGMFN